MKALDANAEREMCVGEGRGWGGWEVVMTMKRRVMGEVE